MTGDRKEFTEEFTTEFIIDAEFIYDGEKLNARCPQTTYIPRAKGASWTSFDEISVADLTAQLKAELDKRNS